MNHLMGTGYLGETKMGPDGNLYQWVEGIDGLGNPIGFWSKLKKLGKKALRTAARYHPGVQALNWASRGVSGYDGLGALYEAPDGSLYQMQGMGNGEGMGADDLTQIMGFGSFLGETRVGPDGGVYQWVQGVDGLGNSIGFWKRLKRLAKRVARKALPIVQQVAPFIPGGAVVSSALRTATPFLKQAGVAGYDGLGALYQAPDGTVYQMQGFANDDSMQGFADDEMAGLAEEELQGFADNDMSGLADEDLQGFADDEMGEYGDNEMAGFADDDMSGFADDEALQGYVQQNGMNGLAAYVPQQPPSTRWFQQPGQTPKIWEAPW
jgi:hypothetical protein